MVDLISYLASFGECRIRVVNLSFLSVASGCITLTYVMVKESMNFRHV